MTHNILFSFAAYPSSSSISLTAHYTFPLFIAPFLHFSFFLKIFVISFPHYSSSSFFFCYLSSPALIYSSLSQFFLYPLYHPHANHASSSSFYSSLSYISLVSSFTLSFCLSYHFFLHYISPTTLSHLYFSSLFFIFLS